MARAIILVVNGTSLTCLNGVKTERNGSSRLVPHGTRTFF
jgi:hypothetical protein